MWTKKNKVIFTPTGDTTSQAIRKIANEMKEIYKYINRLFKRDASDLPPDDKVLYHLWYATNYNKIRAFDGSSWRCLGMNGGMAIAEETTYSLLIQNIAVADKNLFVAGQISKWNEDNSTWEVYGIYIGKFGYDLRPQKQIVIPDSYQPIPKICGYLDSLYVSYVTPSEGYYFLEILHFDKNLNLQNAKKIKIQNYSLLVTDILATENGVYMAIHIDGDEYGIIRLGLSGLGRLGSVFYSESVVDRKIELFCDKAGNIYASCAVGGPGFDLLLLQHDYELTPSIAKKVDSYYADDPEYYLALLTDCSGEDELYFTGWTRDKSDQSIRIPILLKTDQQLNKLESWKLDERFWVIEEDFFIGRGIIAKIKDDNFIKAISIKPPLGEVGAKIDNWLYLAKFPETGKVSRRGIQFISTLLPAFQANAGNITMETMSTSISKEEYDLQYESIDYPPISYSVEAESYDVSPEEIDLNWSIYYG